MKEVMIFDFFSEIIKANNGEVSHEEFFKNYIEFTSKNQAIGLWDTDLDKVEDYKSLWFIANSTCTEVYKMVPNVLQHYEPEAPFVLFSINIRAFDDDERDETNRNKNARNKRDELLDRFSDMSCRLESLSQICNSAASEKELASWNKLVDLFDEQFVKLTDDIMEYQLDDAKYLNKNSNNYNILTKSDKNILNSILWSNVNDIVSGNVTLEQGLKNYNDKIAQYMDISLSV